MTDDLLTEFRSNVPLPDDAATQRIYARATSGRRQAPRRRLVLAVAIAALAVPAAVLGSGLISSSPSPQWVGQHLQSQFVSNVAIAAEQDPGRRFARASRASIARVLARNRARFRYRVERLEVLPGRDGAPLIVLDVHGGLKRFARSVRALEQIVDPTSNDGRMKYEAFFLEADDARGVPFLVVWNVWRQPIGGGGQWAREESLLPFGHL